VAVPSETIVSLMQIVWDVPSTIDWTPTDEFSKKIPLTGAPLGFLGETGKVVPVLSG
jgi:hypothetical protein